jgi:hypothetical protein
MAEEKNAGPQGQYGSSHAPSPEHPSAGQPPRAHPSAAHPPAVHDGRISSLLSDVGVAERLDRDPPRIAVYDLVGAPPRVLTLTERGLPAVLEGLAARVDEEARVLGGAIPSLVIRELIDNLVHARFEGVVVTILDAGNTIRISDRGPGIRDKEAALRPGFSSADPETKQLIRGVGSGFSLAFDALAGIGGTLEIEDNLLGGTVVTVRLPPPIEKRLAPERVPTYNLPERQLKALLLALELAPVGPTRIARELGISTSTAYRDLLSLEEAGLVLARPTGHRSVTEAGLAFVEGALGERA